MNVKFFHNYILFVFLFTSCSKFDNSSKDLSNVKVEYIKIPVRYNLRDFKRVTLNIKLGDVQGFRVYDSLMIISKRSDDKLWSFYSLPKYRHLGDFLDKGRGPFELAMSPSLHHLYHTEEGLLCAYLRDDYVGNVFNFNITESLKTDSIHISKLEFAVPNSVFNYVPIDSTKALIKQIENNNTKQNRYIFNSDGTKTTNSFLDRWNKESVKEGDNNHNIISSIIRYHKKNDRFVETQSMMNYLSIYSLDGSFAKVICFSDELDTPRKIERISTSERMYYFGGVRLYDDFFGVLYFNEKVHPGELGEKEKYPSIILFNWEGDPLAELVLGDNIYKFDIDFNNGDLYTYDNYEGQLYKYNIQSILDELKR